jgi:uncharacterized Fe-S cluster-containing protein
MTKFTAEDTAEHINGLRDSASMIASIIAEDVRDSEAMDSVGRNVRHIEIMCAMQHVKESGADLKPFTDAAAAGTAWMAA